MNVYDYPKELNTALNYKKEGKTFEQYESAAQDHLQPIECQIFWLLAEDVMDIVAEEVNKETAEISKMLGEKERELNKLKKRLNKMSGTLDISDNDDFEFKAIGKVGVTIYSLTSSEGRGINGAAIDDVVLANVALVMASNEIGLLNIV